MIGRVGSSHLMQGYFGPSSWQQFAFLKLTLAEFINSMIISVQAFEMALVYHGCHLPVRSIFQNSQVGFGYVYFFSSFNTGSNFNSAHVACGGRLWTHDLSVTRPLCSHWPESWLEQPAAAAASTSCSHYQYYFIAPTNTIQVILHNAELILILYHRIKLSRHSAPTF